MAKKRNWDSLSPTYRKRLERGGLTKTTYNKGAPLAKARGHAKAAASPKSALTTKGKNLKPLKGTKKNPGKKFRDIEIPIRYKKGLPDLDRAWDEWELVQLGLKANPNIFANNTLIIYEHNDTTSAYPLDTAQKRPKLDPVQSGFEHIKNKYLVKLEGDLKLIALVVHVIFTAKYLKSMK